MEQLNRFALISFLAMTILLISLGAKAQTGIVKGKIIDIEQNLSLPGATVLIKDQNFGAVSDLNGIFRITNLSEGNYTLIISYIGYETTEKEISITSNKTTEVSLELRPKVIMGEEVVVIGERLKGQAKALNQQRTNANITNVVASDQIGRFPDSNIGDALKRIPGLTVQNDFGEARFGLIRGTAKDLNSVMINGERVPSAEPDQRSVQLDLVPADMIQTVEVSKALTPDMDADAIGGTVNLVTRSAPNKLRVSATGGSGYNFLSKEPLLTGALVFGNRFFNKKLGLILSGSYNDNRLGADNIEAEWDEDSNGNAYISEHDVRSYIVQRVRRSISASLDYIIDPNSTITLSAIYNHRDDWENRYRLRYSKIDEPVNGISEGRIRRQTKGGINNDRNEGQRLEDQRTSSTSIKGDHLIKGKVKLNWAMAYSKASEERPNERYIEHEVRGVNLVNNITDPRKPNVYSEDANEATLNQLGLKELWEQNQFTEEEDFNARLDLELPLSDGKNKSVIKFGGRLRNKEKVKDNIYTEYIPLNSASFEPMDVLPLSDRSDADYLAGSQYQIGEFVTTDFLSNLNLYDPALFEAENILDEYVTGNFDAEERITAGYLMLNQNIGDKLFLIAGARVENTDITYNSFELDENENVSPTTGEKSYTNFLPGVHVKYDLSENSIVRFAWSNTLARPRYADLAPFRQVNFGDSELEVGNPDLEPTRSMNFDLMAENYFKTIGVVSAGLFYKEIQDFIYSVDENDYTDPVSSLVFSDFSTVRNGEGASVFGFELAVQRQLDFLPGVLKGVGIYGNYTYTSSKVEGIPGRTDESLSLPGTAKHTYNFSLSFESKKLYLRASLNHASDYIDELGGSSFFDVYYDKQTFVDLNASYTLTNKLRFFTELNNLTNQPLRYYQGSEERTRQEEFYNARFSAGLKFDL